MLCAYLPDERLDAAGATVDLVEGDLADDLVAVLPVMQSQWLLRMTAVAARDTLGTYLRSFLIFSISPGSLAAKVSFSDCN